MARPAAETIDRSEADRVVREACYRGQLEAAVRCRENPLPFSARTFSRYRWSQKNVERFVEWAAIEGVSTSAERLVRSEAGVARQILNAFFAHQRTAHGPFAAVRPYLSPDCVFECDGSRAGLPFAGRYLGHAGVARYLSRIHASVLLEPDPACPPEIHLRSGYLAVGGVLVARARGDSTGIPLRFENHMRFDAELGLRYYQNLVPVDRLADYIR